MSRNTTYLKQRACAWLPKWAHGDLESIKSLSVSSRIISGGVQFRLINLESLPQRQGNQKGNQCGSSDQVIRPCGSQYSPKLFLDIRANISESAEPWMSEKLPVGGVQACVHVQG